LPDEFRVTFGRGGGFTGQWSGYTIRASGSVSAWSGPIQEENAEVVGMLTAEQMQALWHEIQSVDYFSLERRETGNMTAYMEVAADSVVHRSTWIPDFMADENERSPLEKLYSYALSLARGAAAADS